MGRSTTEPLEPSNHVASAPRLAEGAELIGEYQDSGFKEPVYLMRRIDGQVIQSSRLLYLVAGEADGRKDFDQIALEVSTKFGRTVSGDNVRFLVEEKLRPLGMLAATNGANLKLKRARPTLVLRFRVPIFSERTAQAISAVLWPLFLRPIVIAMFAGFVALDFWLFFIHGLSQSVGEAFSRPEFFATAFLVTMFVGFFHEFGHAAAARYGGAKPGRIGMGIYIVWPVYYSDVTDTYRLGRISRLRVDLGGIYFDLLYCLALAGAYFYTEYEPLLLVILLLQFEILEQFTPVIRLDGYYVISDLVGVPDLFRLIKPIVKSMIPGRGTDERVRQLKPWVRVVVTVWVATTIPALLALFGWLVANTPFMITTALDSSLASYDKGLEALGKNEVIDGSVAVLQAVMLLLPVAGLALVYGMVLKNVGKLVWKAMRQWSVRKPALRTGFAITGVLAAGAALSAIINIDLFWPSYKTVLVSADPPTSTSSPALVAPSISKTTSTPAVSSTSETAAALKKETMPSASKITPTPAASSTSETAPAPKKETVPTVVAAPSVGTDGSPTMPVNIDEYAAEASEEYLGESSSGQPSEQGSCEEPSWLFIGATKARASSSCR